MARYSPCAAHFEPGVERLGPLDPAAVRAAADAVVPLAKPQLVLRVAALEEPLERADTRGVVIHAVDREHGDVRLLRAAVPVAMEVPVEYFPEN